MAGALHRGGGRVGFGLPLAAQRRTPAASYDTLVKVCVCASVCVPSVCAQVHAAFGLGCQLASFGGFASLLLACCMQHAAARRFAQSSLMASLLKLYWGRRSAPRSLSLALSVALVLPFYECHFYNPLLMTN